jgi:hypothetical protein
VVLNVCLEVTGNQRAASVAVHAVTADGDGLEHEHHPSRQVRIGVLVAADLPAQLVE